jgi:glutamate-1-semialdehyde 2,1-aminomutase
LKPFLVKLIAEEKMAKSSLEKIGRYIEETYVKRTAESRARDRQARNHLPGGDTRSTLYYSPYPTYMQYGSGCRLFDWDGKEYLDFLSNYASLIHGHAHPEITNAACREMEKGTIFGAPSEIQFLHAGHLCQRTPGIETLRYCNSGTEATMFAIRAARAFTGKDGIIKMDGGYHGTHDVAEVNLIPDIEAQGLPSYNIARGVPSCTIQDVFIAPFNDLDAVENLLSTHRDRIAAVIVEPIMGASGLINPVPGYLKGLREITRRFDSLLIFDEIITFRLNTGGMQAIEKTIPDLTTLGKFIGGGFPVGAFGGRKDIMAVYDPSCSEPVGHGGTFNGNNVTLAAGMVALRMLDQRAIDRLNAMGDRLRAGFEQALNSVGIFGRITGKGSLMSLHFGVETPTNALAAALGARKNKEFFRPLHLQLANLGIHTAPRGMYIVSTPMSEKEIDRAIAAFEETLDLLKPGITENRPDLIIT